VDLTDYTLAGMDTGDCVVLVLLDLSSAFDTVDHGILLQKLKQCGVNGTALEWLRISVLGPLLFTFYIHDIAAVFEKHKLKYIAYADDLQLMTRTSVSCIGDAFQKLNSCIEDLIIWFKSNSLCNNAKKTECIIFCSKNQINTLQSAPLIKVGTATISSSACVRNLGVLLDQHMSMSAHVDNTCKIAFAHLRNISKLRRSIDNSTCAMLVHGLVLSRLEYCCSLFYGINTSEMKKLQRVIKASIRVVEKLKKSDDVSQFFTSAKYLNMENRITWRICSLVYNALARSAPSNIAAAIQIKERNRQLRSSSNVQLEVTVMKKLIGERAFRSVAPRVMNTMALEEIHLSSIHRFRNHVLSRITARQAGQ
jgi:hypothetical protein